MKGRNCPYERTPNDQDCQPVFVLFQGSPVQRAEGPGDGSRFRLLLRRRLPLRDLHVHVWHELRLRRAGASAIVQPVVVRRLRGAELRSCRFGVVPARSPTQSLWQSPDPGVPFEDETACRTAFPGALLG